MQLDRLLQQVSNYTNDALIITENGSLDGDGPRIVYVNHAFSALTGYTPEEVIGKTPRLLQGPKTDEETLARIKRALRDKKPIVAELVNYSKQKHEYWVELSITPVLNESGECTHFISIEKDITERRVMQEATEQQGIALLNSELRTRAILYSIGDGIITFTPDGHIESLSPAAEHMFGQQAIDLEDADVTSLFPDAFAGDLKQWFEEIAQGVLINDVREISGLRHGGGVFTAEINLSRVTLNGKSLLVMAVRDVTELKTSQRKAAKQSERIVLLQEAATIANNARSLDEALAGILNLICDHYWFSAGHCWRADPSSERLTSFGVWSGTEYEPLRTMSLSLHYIAGCGTVGKTYALNKALCIDDITTAPGIIRREAFIEAELAALYSIPICSGNQVLGVMEFFNPHPLTLETDDLEILQNIGCQLGRAIERERIHQSLSAAKDAAISATRAKSEFLANMSHELRTPMNGILGLADLMRDTQLSTEQSECIEALTSSAASLLTILNDILDFSKIEAGELKLERLPFALKTCVEHVRDFMAPLAARKNLALNCVVTPDVPTVCLGDANRLQQVMFNLVGNAIKFTSTGSISLRAFNVPGCETPKIRFEIQDTGIGVPKEFQDVIFNKFTQVDNSASRKYGGTGLGLAISRQLIEMMGGDVGVDSEPGKGSTFWFTIPATRSEFVLPEAPAAITGMRQGVPASEAKILMVEDHPINQMLLSKLLMKLGITSVDKAENGREALKALEKKDYTVVLMDCQMPELDGYETTRHIRDKEAGSERHLPIIALTANAMVGDQERCLKSGMDYYISKPVSLHNLAQALGHWLNIDTTQPAAQQGMPAATTDHTPIDIEHLNVFTDGNIDDERELFILFLDRAHETVHALSQVLESDNEEWRRASHLLKGASGNLGAKTLFALCHVAEQYFESDVNDKRCQLDAIQHELQRVEAFIAKRHDEMHAI